MNYRRSGSIGNSSTSSRSSDPRGTVSRRETYLLFTVLLSVFTRLFLLFFLCFYVLFHYCCTHSMRNCVGEHSCLSITFPIALLKTTNYCSLRSTIRFGIRAHINYIFTNYTFFLLLIPCESYFDIVVESLPQVNLFIN